MLKALTFLGTGPRDGYQPTTYLKHDGSDSCETHLFPEAVATLYQPDETIVFVTPLVREDERGYLRYLEEKLGDRLRTVDIPDGTAEAELWEIFQICADSVDENDEILLDITHGFRSLPLLIFVVAAYLQQVKRVKLKHVIYGAFESRAEGTDATPIFDLTPFVALMEWMNAFAIFQNSGDARELAKLGLPHGIEKNLTTVSAALLTNRTLEAQRAVSGFIGNDLNHPKSLAKQPAPFRAVTERLKASYADMGVRQPEQHPTDSLKAQCQQIRWYMENRHYLQAVTLMREWLVSWECIARNPRNWRNIEVREAAEKRLNNSRLSSRIGATRLWRRCIDIRNDLAHCGMREKPRGAAKAMKEAEELFGEFVSFVTELEL